MSKQRFKRTYDVSAAVHKWLKDVAKKNGRSVIRQVENIFEEAMQNEKGDQKNG